jgi:release factor glutamine methyltransferase
MTIQQAYLQLLQQLSKLYDNRESGNIADLVIEKITGLRKIDRIVYKDTIISPEQQNLLSKITSELVQHKPVQYAIGEAWFMGMKLLVNEQVLIPRPETEELASWIIQDIKTNKKKEVSVLDIGTGSGCIPIAIKQLLPYTSVTAIDISEGALQIAKMNSVSQNVLIDFLLLDILDEVSWQQLGQFDIIVSNPPYIRTSEGLSMRKNVMDYEPHLALFVSDHYPLLFYKKIAAFAKTHLNQNGIIYAEINEELAQDASTVFQQNGFFSIEIRKDMQGKDRMVSAKRN